ncbi:hypothetical protein MVLG_03580 [Microbotryum lychnidis-dioicae p1A1 Lamole]|uniref:Oxo-4-hydroxy-4-carboxy-5-ureidoimidazoline decarboxylase domain-containing protein n=1 Tax=Microbotryum lychnidis-dioicae (strain p1A1 Lamole / MvSl-1064) TaxID=683840 RepID=U5H8M6_USTV1|nr:hypothetical protein MVLG_03580 [Microbotryum lychnidis-dioicae p1A1 Lamole]|eukprot:KDE06025.1 hypothetical protein MVLG_03580 [Microbotryum lychnidis-dioicae p1A1 Lamole]
MTETLPPPRISLLVHAPASSLVPVLTDLLEPSPPLTQLLVPQLHASFSQSSPPSTYRELLERAASIVESWDVQDQAEFLASHPRIGETIGLSSFSGKEQAPAQGATPGEVLKRLSMLNSLYEEAFPGLRFVTFVNGRPRAAIVPEIEEKLDLVLPEPSPSTPEPRLFSLQEKIKTHVVGSKAWRDELSRGLKAMWDIAQSRLVKMGVD